ncbi:hypothetical protein [Psychrobium sp. 1_MG-2023]|uniref:hypothetical protein n=1 Tax=Psychrobium sp. 1_MG-2023 TaxID=3062624 RepID=UPI000C3302B6|nr:hypothetical protein [Psychrobium sp. 1_MG-2023]MDP2561994.1 hypothetical protein [Psychrobium sp. 1_MG-2023]PKF58624.1 hypothetical protein CW748_03045 [Alteromonadales bacterium alter-6D02]
MKLLSLSITVLLLIAFNASAKSTQDKIQHCAKFEDNKKRLTCFDSLVIKKEKAPKGKEVSLAKSEVILETAKPKAVVNVAEPKKLTQQFGFESKVITQTPESLTFTVQKVQKNPHGKLKITFKNGQIWQQRDSKRFRLKTDEQVIVSKGAWGSFFLQKPTANSRIKIKRLK